MVARPQKMVEEEESITPSPRAGEGQETERSGIARRVRHWLRSVLRERGDNSLKEALEEILEEHEHDNGSAPVSEEETILKNVLSFGEREARDIMTPRPDILAVEFNTSLEGLKSHIAQHSHTRIPVYNDSIDNIKGFIHIKDLMPHLAGDAPFKMALILRDILFVPPSMKLAELLLKMRVSGVHIAIVIDEYGATDGLVTLEDVFEEIVGEIQDEHDEEEQECTLSWNAHGLCEADARTPIDKLESALHLSLQPEEGEDASYDTLGGLLFYHYGRVPKTGETLEHPSGLRFEVLDADPRRIRKVRMTRLQPENAA